MMPEDSRIMFRELEKKLVETLLLILAVALGVGVAASGFSLATTANYVTQQELKLPQYREIIISSRTNAEDFSEPALLTEEGKKVTLSAGDLVAANEVPLISGGFIMEEQSYHLGSPPVREGGSSSQQAERETSLLEVEESMVDEPTPLYEELHGYKVSSEFFSLREMYPSQGSLFTLSDMESKRPFLVVGSEIGETLFEDGLALDRKLQVFDTIYKIVGVLEPTGTIMDKRVFSPHEVSSTSMMRGPGRKGSDSQLYFSTIPGESLEQASNQLLTWFNNEYGEGWVNLDIPRVEAEESADRNGRLIRLILFLAMAGLLIASVNVSNILMGRALRREKMVGILKALGASRQRIFRLFLEEALMIGLSGAVVGVIFALILTRVMTRSMGLEAFSLAGIVGGITLSFSITLVLTLLPAYQASKIEAANAMRTE